MSQIFGIYTVDKFGKVRLKSKGKTTLKNSRSQLEDTKQMGWEAGLDNSARVIEGL